MSPTILSQQNVMQDVGTLTDSGKLLFYHERIQDIGWLTVLKMLGKKRQGRLGGEEKKKEGKNKPLYKN